MNLPLILNPNLDSPGTKSQGFNSPDGCEINESVSIALKTPMVKKSRCMFSPRKLLEQVVGELKGKASLALANEPNHNHNDKPTVRRIRKGKKKQSSDLNFMNKRAGNIIIKNTTNFKTIINSELSDSSFANF